MVRLPRAGRRAMSFFRKRGGMAGMPLFAHVGREKLTPPPLSMPLERIKFCGFKPPNPLFNVLRRRTGLVFACFAPQNNRQNREGTRGNPLCPQLAVLPKHVRMSG